MREFFGSEPFLVTAADALTDIDLEALARTHREHDGIATLATKRVTNVSEYGVVVTGADGRVQGFQEKPDPGEALSDLANCMIYVLEPEIFDYFPDREEVDFALDVFPALLEHDVPFGVHVADAYWNDVGSLSEYLQGNLDVLNGAVAVEPAGALVEPGTGDGLGDGIEQERPRPGRRGSANRRRRAARRAGGARPERLDRGRSPGAGVGPARRSDGARAGGLAAGCDPRDASMRAAERGTAPAVELLWWAGCPSCGARRSSWCARRWPPLGLDPGALVVREVGDRGRGRARALRRLADDPDRRPRHPGPGRRAGRSDLPRLPAARRPHLGAPRPRRPRRGAGGGDRGNARMTSEA